MRPSYIIAIVSIIYACSSQTPSIIYRPESNHTRLFKSSSTTKRCKKLLPLIKKAANKVGIDYALLVGLVRIESNFHPKIRSRAGAIGLTQVMPTTARMFNCKDVYDPYQNLLCGARAFRSFLKYYNGNIMLALSGYNAGHFYPDQAMGKKKLPKNFRYVEEVLRARSHFIRYGCRW